VLPCKNGGVFMGLFKKLLGTENSNDVKELYAPLLDSIQALAKAGAAYGQYHGFFMHVQCRGDIVYITIEVEFGDHLNFLKKWPLCFQSDLEAKGVSESEYDFLMKTLKIVHEDERHDVGSTWIEEPLKKSRHAQPVFEAVKERLIKIPHTTHSIDNNQFSISLHDE
jgi:hypothetical protein